MSTKLKGFSTSLGKPTSLKKLKGMLSKKGSLSKLELKLVLLQETMEEDPIFGLKEFLKETTKFQDKNLRSMTYILNKIKIKRPEIFIYFAPLYHTLKVCGREQNKTTRHKTGLVVNKANKGEKENPKLSNIFVYTDMYVVPQPLLYIRRIQKKTSKNLIEEKAIENIEKQAKKFMFQNMEHIKNQMNELRKIL